MAHLARLVLLFACIAVAGCVGTDTAAPRNSIAFVGVSVLPMTGAATVLPDQTVIVEGDRIVALGPRSKVRIARGAARVDGRGRYLMPGLADMHVHLEHLEDADILKLFVAHGVTTVRSMDGRPFILDWRRRVAAGEIVGPAIVTAGPIVDGAPPLRDDNLSAATPAAAAAAVREQARAGYDFIKVYTNLSPEAYRAAAAAAKAEGRPLTGHVPRDVELDEAIKTQSAIEHLAHYAEAVDARPDAAARRWHWTKLYVANPMAAAKADALARRLAVAGVATVPTLVEAARRVGKEADLLAWSKRAEMALLPQEAVAGWLGQARGAGRRLDEADWALLARGDENRSVIVRALHRAGAPLLVGTDTPNPFLVPGASLHDELSAFVEAGLSPGEALLIATAGAARFLRQEREWGRIARGMRADLLLLDANPLADIGNSRRIAGVLASGRWHPRENLPALARALVD